ncbi:hypothetical protein B0T12DRAFT_400767 [Alternaria alternata]|nr:hypothetical protein B0T12DRAFT_400767 [Alternaria alternata]
MNLMACTIDTTSLQVTGKRNPNRKCRKPLSRYWEESDKEGSGTDKIPQNSSETYSDDCTADESDKEGSGTDEIPQNSSETYSDDWTTDESDSENESDREFIDEEYEDSKANERPSETYVPDSIGEDDSGGDSSDLSDTCSDDDWDPEMKEIGRRLGIVQLGAGNEETYSSKLK